MSPRSTADQADRVDLQQQRGRAAILVRLGVEDVRHARRTGRTPGPDPDACAAGSRGRWPAVRSWRSSESPGTVCRNRRLDRIHISATVGSMTDSEYDQRALIAGSKLGVLATIRSSGVPQMSPVTAVYDRDTDTVLVSVTEGRAKTRNLRRDPQGGDRVHQLRRLHLGDRRGVGDADRARQRPAQPRGGRPRRLLPARRGRTSRLGGVSPSDGVRASGSARARHRTGLRGQTALAVSRVCRRQQGRRGLANRLGAKEIQILKVAGHLFGTPTALRPMSSQN